MLTDLQTCPLPHSGNEGGRVGDLYLVDLSLTQTHVLIHTHRYMCKYTHTQTRFLLRLCAMMDIERQLLL